MEAQRTRRFERPGFVVLLVAIVVVLVAAAFVAGFFVKSPTQQALANAQRPIEVTATVKKGTVDSGADFGGKVTAGSTESLGISASPAVVTREAISVGDSVAPGSFLGSIAGNPYFALKAPLPLYRDLASGDSGDDVKALQTSLQASGLSVRVSGKVDGQTLAAVKSLFVKAGYATPASIPFAQLVPLSGPGTATSAASVGTTVSQDNPLVSVQTGVTHVVFRADEISADSLAIGSSMTVQAQGVSFPMTITSIGAFDNGGNGTTPGKDVVLGSNATAFTALKPGTNVVAHQATEASESLTVPVTAIRHDQKGDYVLLDSASAKSVKAQRVQIDVLRSGNGIAAIHSAGLKEGDHVLVS